MNAGMNPDALREAIKASGLFDASFYLATYRGVMAGFDDPLAHFAAIGLARGYLPCAGFDPIIHRLTHPDCGDANPLVHAASGAMRGESQPGVLDLFPVIRANLRQLGHPGPDFDIAEEFALNRAYAGRAAEPRQIPFELAECAHFLTNPDPKEFLDRLRRNSPFAIARLPEGFWDAIYKIETIADMLARIPLAAILSTTERRTLAIRMCRALYPHNGVYVEAHLEELLDAIGKHPPQANFFRSISLKGYPTWNEKLFNVRRLQPRHLAQMAIIARHFRPGETLIDGTLWKRWVVSGVARELPALCRPHPVVLVASGLFGTLGQRWKLPHFRHVHIRPAMSQEIRWSLLDQCRAALSQARNADGKHPIMLMRCGGSLAYWLITHLAAEFPNTFYLDLGQALNTWFFDVDKIQRHPWMDVYEQTIIENCDLTGYYRSLAREQANTSHSKPHLENSMDHSPPRNTASAIIILGMHRSGTSALTGVLARLGIDAGPNLQDGNEFNARGYWEHKDVVRIHDELFRKLGSGWQDTRPLPAGWEHGPSAESARAALAALLQRDFGASDPWLVKDPRMCRLLPLWRKVLEDLGVRPCYVIMTRHPAEVASSLAKRDDMPETQALLLWLQHMVEIERQTRGQRRVAVTYDQLLDDWRSVVDRIAATLDVKLPSPGPETDSSINDFLSSDLRHHRERDAATASPLSGLALSVYDALSQPGASENLAVALDQPGKWVDLASELMRAASTAANDATDSAPLLAQARAIQAELTRLAAQPASSGHPSPAHESATLPPLSPTEEQLQYQQAESHLAAGEKQQAMAMLESLARRQSIRWEIYNDLGTLLLEEGRTEEAIAALRSAVSLEFSSTIALRNLAAAYVAANEIGQLLAVCHQLLKREPDDQQITLFLRDVILMTEMRLDDHAWVSPALARMPAQIDALRRRVAELESENRLLKVKSRLFDHVVQKYGNRPEMNPALGIRKENQPEQENDSTRSAPLDETRATWQTIHALSAREWQEVLLNSVHEPQYRGFPLPGFPPESLQVRMVGSSNENALSEGFRFYAKVRELCVRHHANISGEGNLLDFGTGWGRYARIFMKDFKPENILGVDVDQGFISICKEIFPYGNFEVVPPFPPTSLPAGHFDLIIAYSVFSHLSEEAATAWIKEFSRILAPGGMIAVTTQGRSFLNECERIRESGRIDHPWHENLARSFVDKAACEKTYDEGGFLFSPTGAGAARPSTFYGEALISPGFVKKQWAEHLELLEFIDNRGYLPQALIVMKKTENRR